MAGWRAAKSLLTLRAEVDAAHPNRPKQADGLVGDARHQAEKSDHNPTDPHPGVVTAWDITTADFTITLAESLRLMGKAGDGRVKYVIYRGQIASSREGWAWRPYSGFSKHFDHIHLSVADDPKQYDRTDPWLTHTGGGGRIPATSFQPAAPVQEDDMTPEQATQLAEVHQMLTALVAPRRTDHVDTDPKHTSLGDVLTEVDNKAGQS